jgi:MFS family permease
MPVFGSYSMPDPDGHQERLNMATAQQQMAQSPGAGKKTGLMLVTIFLTYFVFGYFLQIMLAATPRIAALLNGMHLYSWGVSIPNLGLAFSMLMVGKLSDMYGRRALMLLCLIVCLAGTIWSALSSTFVMLIIARTFLCIGQGGLAPLCFSLLGDMFEPVQRSKWVGLLNIPGCCMAMFGAPLGGWFVESLSWRYIFWCGAPLLVLCLVMALFGLPKQTQRSTSKIDGRGALLAAVASATLIIGFSLAGTIYPWASKEVIGLLAASAIFWVLFIKAEAGAEEPILDLEVLKNRTFITIISAGLLSCFGMIGLMIYYPLMIQSVQSVSATKSGWIIALGNFLMNFFGFPAGFILARTKRYKWMFIMGYGITVAVMFALIFFKSDTRLIWGFLAITLAGMGMGSIPTLNTLVAQYAVPKRLLGVATAALYFSVMLGQAIAPAILGSAWNTKYKSTVEAKLPAEVYKFVDRDKITNPDKAGALLVEKQKAALLAEFNKNGSNGEAMLGETISAIRLSMESGLRIIYIVGAIAMLLTFLIICTIPEISIDAVVEDKKAVEMLQAKG